MNEAPPFLRGLRDAQEDSTMELEHLFQQSGAFMTLQLIFFSSLLLPGAMGRLHAAARIMASVVVSFGPMALLVYILYQVSRLG